jgi:hypothetical protein
MPPNTRPLQAQHVRSDPWTRDTSPSMCTTAHPAMGGASRDNGVFCGGQTRHVFPFRGAVCRGHAPAAVSCPPTLGKPPISCAPRTEIVFFFLLHHLLPTILINAVTCLGVLLVLFFSSSRSCRRRVSLRLCARATRHRVGLPFSRVTECFSSFPERSPPGAGAGAAAPCRAGCGYT